SASMKGVHSLTRVLHELRSFAIQNDRIVPVLNRATRAPRARAEIARALASLGVLDGTALAGPLFVPERRHLDDVLVHAAPPPARMIHGVASGVQALLDRPRPVVDLTAPVTGTPVIPGSLGTWYDEPEDAA